MLSGPEVLDRAEQLTNRAVHVVQSGMSKASATGEASEQVGGLNMFGSFVSEATANIAETCNFKPKLGRRSWVWDPVRAHPKSGCMRKATNGCFSLTLISVCVSPAPPNPPSLK